MFQLVSRFWDICRLRAGPQDLPDSKVLLYIALAAYLVVTLVRAFQELSPGNAVFATLIDTGLMALLSYMVLWIRLWTDRWRQTFTALAGTGAIVGAISIPLALWVHSVGVGTPAAAMPSLLSIGLLIWMLFVIAHILRHALSVHLLLGGALAALYLYISTKVMSALFFAGQ